LSGRRMDNLLSRTIQHLWATALEKAVDEGRVKDPKRVDAAIRAWDTMGRNHIKSEEEQARKMELAGDAQGAKAALARANEWYGKMDERLKARGQPPMARPDHNPRAVPPAPPVPPAPQPPQAKAEKKEKEGPAKPKVARYEGRATEIEAQFDAEREKLHQEGFKRVDVDPLRPDKAGAQKGSIELAHPDGRKVMLQMKYDPGTNKGHVRVVSHAAPKAVPMDPGSIRDPHRGWTTPVVKDNPQPAVMEAVESVRNADKDSSFISSIKLIAGPEQRKSGFTYLVNYADGKKTIYKPGEGTGLERYPREKGHKIREELDEKIHESARELAAYKLSESAGMNVTPHVEVLGADTKFPHGRGHTMAFVAGTDRAKLPREEWIKDLQDGHPDLHRIAALDFLCGNTDRHLDNFRKGSDGRYYSIDNGLDFPKDSLHEEASDRQGAMQTLGEMGTPAANIPEKVLAEIGRWTPEIITKSMQESGFREIDIKGAIGRMEELKTLTKWPMLGGSIVGLFRNAGERAKLVVVPKV